MAVTRQSEIVERAGRRFRLENEKRALQNLKARLDSLKFWTPAPQLSKVVEETLAVVDALEERLEAKAIVAVVGGTGAGKSTLVNALCGKDETVKSGNSRPTTRGIAALARTAGDADVLLKDFAAGEITAIQDFGFRFRDVVLVDTPDTDSSECAGYADLLDRVLRRADALVCVFPAEDPKRRDNIVRLAETVSKYQAEHVFLVVNQCDRIKEDELEEVKSDFERNIAKSWRKTGEVFLVSARASLRNPGWPEGERPLHGVNEFNALCGVIGELDGSRFADSRVERARQLRAETERYVLDSIAGCGDWNALRGRLEDFEKKLAGRIVEEKADALVSSAGDVSSLVYRKTAERWHGPVGFYLQCGLLLSGAVSCLRYLNPLNWRKRAASRYLGVLQEGRTDEEALCDEALAFDWDAAKGAVVEEWGRIGPELAGAFKMSPELLDGEKAVAFDGLEEEMQRRWPGSLNAGIERIARSKSGLFRQVFAHLPLVVTLAWSLYGMTAGYFAGKYLPRDYYPHLLAIVLLLWLLPSWLVQLAISGSKPHGAKALKKELLAAGISAGMLPVAADVDTIISIQRQGGRH